ncbi:VOC family protein [Streptomyces sp. NBC_01381]|uniref:VOC family protein n=1 Tax=Streptomyces sp. NBC_01381 TaxID=2903845 RepID=UPI0022533224|nr:VOC family protein [Streptomyces sp. NBC_01381]MCX4671600.1 VOC family protein [Streptomyces sp. NBC_01381]
MLSTRFLTGAPVWVDLGTPDLERANAFYRALFGWEFQSGGEQFGGYGMYQSGGKTVAGAMTVPVDEAPPSWTIYFKTPDADATSKAVEQAGGSVKYEAVDVGDLGRMAVFTDAQGVGFAVWQPGTIKGLDLVDAPNSMNWTELYTPDIAAAAAFYGTVFGWGTTTQSFPGGSYTMIHPADGTADDMFGGLWPLADAPEEAEGGAYWTPYFQVTDIDAVLAKVEPAGGTVRVPRMDLAGVGSFAKLADPSGARFALMQPEAPSAG